jgi:hypothetical protein
MIGFRTAAKTVRKFIDVKIAVSGAIVMGGIVFCINYSATHELTGSLTAALKQGTYTFFFGGILMKSCELLATGIQRRKLAILASVFIPSVFTLLLTYGMHSMKGTPKPFESTLPTLIIIPATVVWGYISRKQHDQKQQVKL